MKNNSSEKTKYWNSLSFCLILLLGIIVFAQAIKIEDSQKEINTLKKRITEIEWAMEDNNSTYHEHGWGETTIGSTP